MSNLQKSAEVENERISSSLTSFTAYCVIVNDKDSRVLGAIVDHLALLESGGLKPIHQRQIDGFDAAPCYLLRLDTKYYTCDVPVLSYQSTAQLFADHSARKGQKDDFEILSCFFCADRVELTPEFLSPISKMLQSLDTEADVKALILRNADGEEAAEGKPLLPTEEVLNKFAVARAMEIITLPGNGDGEGLAGIARAIEAIETVQWPNMKRKPNPIGGREHRLRMQRYIEEAEGTDEEENDGRKRKDEGQTANNKAVKVADFGKKESKSRLELEAPPQSTSADYPDTEDEDAILEMFDRPFKQDINYSQPNHGIVATNMPTNFDAHKISAMLCNLNEVRNCNRQLPFRERVDVSEGLTYNLLKSISSQSSPKHKIPNGGGGRGRSIVELIGTAKSNNNDRRSEKMCKKD